MGRKSHEASTYIEQKFSGNNFQHCLKNLGLKVSREISSRGMSLCFQS